MIPRFKAWHHELGRMMTIETMYFFANELEELQLNDSVMNDSIPASPNEIDLMQSTGLFDKNGKEIFEGDVVTDGEFARIVQYHQTLGFYMFDEEGNERFFSDSATLEDFEEDAKIVSEILEIIGNVYENPELLEVTE